MVSGLIVFAAKIVLVGVGILKKFVDEGVCSWLFEFILIFVVLVGGIVVYVGIDLNF